MGRDEVRAALTALAANLPQPQADDEVTLAEAMQIMGLRDLGTTERRLTEAGWTCRVAVIPSGHHARVWHKPEPTE